MARECLSYFIFNKHAGGGSWPVSPLCLWPGRRVRVPRSPPQRPRRLSAPTSRASSARWTQRAAAFPGGREGARGPASGPRRRLGASGGPFRKAARLPARRGDAARTRTPAERHGPAACSCSSCTASCPHRNQKNDVNNLGRICPPRFTDVSWKNQLLLSNLNFPRLRSISLNRVILGTQTRGSDKWEAKTALLWSSLKPPGGSSRRASLSPAGHCVSFGAGRALPVRVLVGRGR